MATLLPEGKQSFTNSAGAPLIGGKLFTYDAGTSTPRPTYLDAGTTAPNTNPIILDARGEATVFWDGVYKVILQDAAGAVIWTVDDVASTDTGLGTLRTDLGNTTDPDKGVALVGGAGRAVPNIASLRTLTKTGAQEAFVLGYYGKGDGGGGSYFLDSADGTSADNGGTVIVAADGGRWKLHLTGDVSVRQFGAKGDGVADDTTAIQAAIDSLPVRGGGVNIPSGKYKITRTLQVGDGSNLAASSRNSLRLNGSGPAPYFGAGGGTELTWAGAAGGTVLSYNGSGDGFGLDGVEIDCAGIAAVGLVIYSTRLSSYSNFAVRDFLSTGISLRIRTGPPGSVAFASGNHFQNWIATSIYENTRGIDIQGDYANNNDWHRNTFITGQTQVKRAAVGESYGAFLGFTDSNTWIECDLNVYGAGTGFGLFFNGAANPAYPENNFFYGCSIISMAFYEGPGFIGDNFFYGHTTKDGESIPTHPKLRGITDTGKLFGAFEFLRTVRTLGDYASYELSTTAGDARWSIQNNAVDGSSAGLNILYSVDGVSWVSMVVCTPGGEVRVNIPGVGLTAIGVGSANSAGPGFRQLRTPN